MDNLGYRLKYKGNKCSKQVIGFRNTEGFTLLEMLAVIAVAGILLAVIAPNVIRVVQSSENEANKIQAESVKNAIINFYLDEKEGRTLDEFLDSEVFNENNNNGLIELENLKPYLDGDIDYISSEVEGLVCESFDEID